jgi:hypothetical protein
MKIQPAPLNSKITVDNMLSPTWSTYFRNLSKNMVDACTLNVMDGLYYTINNNLMTIIYNGPARTFQLPAMVATDSFVIYYTILDNVVKPNILDIPKGSTEISFPELGDIRVKDIIVIEQRNR